MQKPLSELRAEWRKHAWCSFRSHIPAMLTSVLVSTWAFPAWVLWLLPPEPPEFALLAWLHLPYLLRAATFLPFAVVISLPLILAGNRYPTQGQYELNDEILRARAAARAEEG